MKKIINLTVWAGLLIFISSDFSSFQKNLWYYLIMSIGFLCACYGFSLAEERKDRDRDRFFMPDSPKVQPSSLLFTGLMYQFLYLGLQCLKDGCDFSDNSVKIISGITLFVIALVLVTIEEIKCRKKESRFK